LRNDGLGFKVGAKLDLFETGLFPKVHLYRVAGCFKYVPVPFFTPNLWGKMSNLTRAYFFREGKATNCQMDRNGATLGESSNDIIWLWGNEVLSITG